MLAIHRKSWAALAVAAAFATPAVAELSAADLNKLGTTLNPLGGEKAGNAAKTIPEWTGGITTPVAGYKPGLHYPDPYKDDKPTLTITGANADQHKALIPDGAYAMLKKYPTYKMVVYPTRRSASAPEGHYKETKECAAKAKLAPGGNGVVGCTGGIPFPIPKDGTEAIWNSTLRYRGDTFAMHWSQAAVTRGGDYALVKFEYEYDCQYGNCSKPVAQREPNKIINFVQATMEGVKYTLAHPEEAVQMLKKHQPQLDEKTAVQEIAIIRKLSNADNAKGPLGSMSKEKMQATQDLMVKYLDLKDPPPIADTYTNEFLS